MVEQTVARRRVPPRIVILAVLALAVVVLAAVAAVGSSPRACGACHAMRPYAEALAKTPHSGVACYGCHLDDGWNTWPAFKAREIARMYPAALAGKDVAGPGIRVTRNACLGCHEAVMAKTVESAGTRIRHASCAEGAACDQCHGGTGHGTATRWVRQPVMDDCVRCHLARNTTVACDTCHADKSTAERLAAGPWQVTHGVNWRATHGMGDITVCAVCHPPSKCVQCHGIPLPHPVDFGRTHGTDAAKPESSCAQCHERKSFCDVCHGLEMPHPAGFLPGHSKVAKSRTDAACLKCHVEQDCLDCHRKHTHPGNTQGTLGVGKK